MESFLYIRPTNHLQETNTIIRDIHISNTSPAIKAHFIRHPVVDLLFGVCHVTQTFWRPRIIFSKRSYIIILWNIVSYCLAHNLSPLISLANKSWWVLVLILNRIPLQKEGFIGIALSTDDHQLASDIILGMSFPQQTKLQQPSIVHTKSTSCPTGKQIHFIFHLGCFNHLCFIKKINLFFFWGSSFDTSESWMCLR